MASRRLRLLFDENFSQLQVAFVARESRLGEILHARKSGFGSVHDKIWIPLAVKAGFVLITGDRNDKTREFTVEDLKRMDARVILVGGWWDHLNGWDKAKWLVEAIERIWDIASGMEDGSVVLLTNRKCEVKEL